MKELIRRQEVSHCEDFTVSNTAIEFSRQFNDQETRPVDFGARLEPVDFGNRRQQHVCRLERIIHTRPRHACQELLATLINIA